MNLSIAQLEHASATSDLAATCVRLKIDERMLSDRSQGYLIL